ncbi:Co2+/Mg2+ efflux protein ApaG [Ectothiorhodospira lacustris]|uniref:Co2+/Mg2+ efflux protein ApaG n=1 Tax=Ectothiorhodospira lacustris TaxID=2899127 RepID=UPI001EE85333|nr:Co2+/Mg2+ efflux protein ApaG [Ectothiorhodospira lacustris]MCG5508863.1 Co2+/Mg2+ efflux protein ApaG [Ectothiorhodospira lacustris]MCG5520654.1 Co2+/Mg2+ efflux protein ApaG [Ectothiorhodospira lacustris]
MPESSDHHIQVEVNCSYVESQSDPMHGRFVFAYTITLRNLGTQGAKLLSRHWIIHDSNGKVQEVRGEGVVGEQPHLNPGQGFQYTSGAMIETPVGTMHGTYRMVADDGTRFEAVIPTFTLSVPRVLH